MGETTEILIDQIDQLSQQTLAACMGVKACGRVCNVDLTPYQADGALPYEYDCAALSETEVTIDPAYRQELTEVVTMPSLDFLGADDTAKEAGAYLEFLRTGERKFEEYATTILRGATLPRTAATTAAEDWRSFAYESPHADKMASLTDDEKAQVQGIYAQLRGFHDLNSLKNHGLLFDTSMHRLTEQAASELSVGHHLKLSGEPGIAKTSLAKYLGRLNAKAHHPDWSAEQCEPILISLASTTEAEAQVTEQTFEDNTLGSRLGLIAEAMEAGRTIILDEQNGMTADQQVYFNDMFLKKPGETMRVGDRTVVIADGFAVIATVNPMTDTQGNRRHGRQQQDSAGAARYTRIDLPYPGQKGYPGDPKETLTRLFYANYVEQYGWQQLPSEVLVLVDNCQEYLVKLTRMATEPPTNGASTNLLASAQARPELAECITPRDFSRMLESVMAHATLTDLPIRLRAAMTTKTRQILNSDNGHFVTPAAERSVDTLLRSNGFTTHA